MATPFHLRLHPNGRSEVSVGDVDLTNVAGAISLNARAMQPPRLIVEVFGDFDVEGVGEVTLIKRGEEFYQFLSGLDAEQLEQAALARLGAWDQGNTTQAILDVLREWVRDL